ncbi:MAG: GNAT family N-acetyltransferase [Clostridiales bacterium]|nr:GNAT family N-acetyltransferase [Clostridiales bacterium]
MIIRFATLEDADQMDRIYEYYIHHATATFLTSPIKEENFRQKICHYGKDLPFLVGVKGEEVVGYSYASHWRYGHAYQWDVEASIYIKKDTKARKLGKAYIKSCCQYWPCKGIKMYMPALHCPMKPVWRCTKKWDFPRLESIRKPDIS